MLSKKGISHAQKKRGRPINDNGSAAKRQNFFGLVNSRPKLQKVEGRKTWMRTRPETLSKGRPAAKASSLGGRREAPQGGDTSTATYTAAHTLKRSACDEVV